MGVEGTGIGERFFDVYLKQLFDVRITGINYYLKKFLKISECKLLEAAIPLLGIYPLQTLKGQKKTRALGVHFAMSVPGKNHRINLPEVWRIWLSPIQGILSCRGAM